MDCPCWQGLQLQIQLKRQERALAKQLRYEAAVAACARLLVARGAQEQHLQRCEVRHHVVQRVVAHPVGEWTSQAAGAGVRPVGVAVVGPRHGTRVRAGRFDPIGHAGRRSS